MFIPIFIYKITHSLPATFFFFSIYHAAAIPGGWLAGKIAQRFGLDILEFSSGILRCFFLLLLMLAKIFPGLIWPAAGLWGITIPFCWLPYYYTVSERANPKHIGETVSKLDIIAKVMVGLGPFLGGLIIAASDFSMLYLVAIVAFLISGAVIFLDDFDKKDMRLDFGKMLVRFWRPSLRKFWLGLVGEGIEAEVYSVAWYLFIYLTVSSYITLGGIQSVSLLVSILLLWLVGRWIDKKGPEILNWGVVGNVLNWIIRPFLLTGLGIFIADLFYKLLSVFIWTPFQTVTYERAEKMEKLEFFIQREWVGHISGLGTSLLLVLISKRFGLNWAPIFSLAIVGLLMCTLILTPGVRTKTAVK